MRSTLWLSAASLLGVLLFVGCCADSWHPNRNVQPALDSVYISPLTNGTIHVSSKWRHREATGNLFYSCEQWINKTRDVGNGVVYVHALVPLSPHIIYSFACTQYDNSKHVTVKSWHTNGTFWFEINDEHYHAKGYILSRGNVAWIVYAGHKTDESFDQNDYDLALQSIMTFERK